jgi:hypothetical protein
MMKTTVQVFGKLLSVDVKEAQGYKVKTFNSVLDKNGKVVKVGEHCSVTFVKGWK